MDGPDRSRHAFLPRRTVLRGGALALGAAAGAVGAGCAPGAGDGVGPDGRVTIELWHGQTDTGRKAMEKQVARFQRAHPKIRVDAGGGVLADAMLQKVTAALAAGSYPDVAYIFGSDLADVARSPKVADMTAAVHSAATPWSDYWPSARTAVTLNGRVRAVPAMVDTLAVICNRKLFRQAGIPLPRAGWRWSQFASTARRLTDHGRGRYGTGWPGAGDEDTVWRIWPMVWDLGGDVIARGGHSIGFAEQGVRALRVVQALARDKSVYIDPQSGSEQMYQVFQSGHMGMVVAGPWQLPDIRAAKIDYHVVPLPSFTGRPMTISGPDTWTVFDNGDARRKAARTFVEWLIQPAHDVEWDIRAGSLPLSRPTSALPEWRRQTERTAGLSVFTDALDYARVRPVHPAYPQISQALAQAVTAMLLGRSTPEKAMRSCADDADAALLIPR